MVWESTAARERNCGSQCVTSEKTFQGLRAGKVFPSSHLLGHQQAKETKPKAQEQCSLQVLSWLPILPGGRGSSRGEPSPEGERAPTVSVLEIGGRGGLDSWLDGTDSFYLQVLIVHLSIEYPD